ncbi:dehydrogenase/reductase SDR family protein 7-like [Clavelina lepadiformis]|uniref:dehydrogenase/reductase SDR family protein 7-like n=1 Tax=Clavelina lepadiformis TaxID=159417 RepID=UPI004042C2CD
MFEIATTLLIGFIILLLVLFLHARKQNPDYFFLVGKVVLITGASSGIGKACSFKFHRHGCKVVLCSRNKAELIKVKESLELQTTALGVKAITPEVHILDLSDISHVEKNVQNIIEASGGKIDIVINNAGVSYRGHVTSTQLEVFQKVMDVNFLGQVAVTKAVLPYMVKSNSGHIISIGSVQGKIAVPHRAPYTASKHACQAFYDSLRSEVAHNNIHVSVVNPGYVKTNLSHSALTDDGSSYGKLDETTAKGLHPDVIAKFVVQSVILKKKEIMVAPFHHKLVVWIRLICPNLYFWLMKKRANV